MRATPPCRYTSDERGLDYLDALTELHGYVAEHDPDHPTWSVFTAGQVGDITDWIGAFDAVGTLLDPVVPLQPPRFGPRVVRHVLMAVARPRPRLVRGHARRHRPVPDRDRAGGQRVACARLLDVRSPVPMWMR